MMTMIVCRPTTSSPPSETAVTKLDRATIAPLRSPHLTRIPTYRNWYRPASGPAIACSIVRSDRTGPVITWSNISR